MIILTTSTIEQTFKVIPRDYPNDITIVLRDEITGEITSKTAEGLEWQSNNEIWSLSDYFWNEAEGIRYEKGYLIITMDFSLIENHFYELKINGPLGVIYRDKIFCTDQNTSDYSVNDGVYTTENSYDNDYIVI